MTRNEHLGFYNTLYKFIAKFDALFVSGFLGQLPTDIRSKVYTAWLKLAGAKIGKGSIVHHKVKIWNPENITIGKGVSIPASTDIAGMAKISIGDYTLVGANVSFITNNHPLEDNNISWQEVLIGTQKSVRVGKFCWLMNDCKLVAGRDGLVVENYSWIAAGSTVLHDIKTAELWGGSPANFIRKIHARNVKK